MATRRQLGAKPSHGSRVKCVHARRPERKLRSIIAQRSTRFPDLQLAVAVSVISHRTILRLKKPREYCTVIARFATTRVSAGRASVYRETSFINASVRGRRSVIFLAHHGTLRARRFLSRRIYPPYKIKYRATCSMLTRNFNSLFHQSSSLLRARTHTCTHQTRTEDLM